MNTYQQKSKSILSPEQNHFVHFDTPLQHFVLSLQGTADWAVKTLNDHRNDKRQWLYTRDELAEAKTHDDLWNAAQIQLT